MTFWHLISESVYSPEFYASLRKKNFLFSDLYLLKLLSLFALVATALVAPPLLSSLHGMQRSFDTNVTSRLPSDFLFTVKEGASRTNLSQPFSIPEKPILIDPASTRKQNVVVVDTRVMFSPDIFKARNALYLVTKDGFATQGDDVTHFTSFKDVDADISISRDDVTTFSRRFSKIVSVLRYAIVPLFFGLILFFLVVGNALYLLFAALVLMLIGYFRGHTFTFPEAYRFSMHLSTLPIAVSFLMWMLVLPIPFIPTLVFIVVACANFPMAKELTPR